MSKNVIGVLLFASLALFSVRSIAAQTTPGATVSDQDLELLRKDLRSMKKQVVAANMQLTDVEAQKFWPVYDQYAAETAKLYDVRYAIIKDYAANIRELTNDQAQILAKRWNDVDGAVIQLRAKYFPIFEKTITGRKTALFFQIDRRLALMIDLQLASEIPLVQP